MPREERQIAINQLVQALIDLRQTSGTPSFREMARRSGCISHTTLHDAVQGHRLPTWITVEQFVLACGGETRLWRTDWERANRVVHRRSGLGIPAPSPELAPAPAPAPSPDPAPSPQPTPSAEPPRATELLATRAGTRGLLHTLLIRRVLAPVGMALVLLAMAVALLGDWGLTGTQSATAAGILPATVELRGSAAPASFVAVATTCRPQPVSSASPRRTANRAPGDHLTFVADVTVGGCMVVAPRQHFTKTWRIRNDGSVVWHDRTLRRTDLPERADGCQTPERASVPDARPGQTVDVSVAVVAPRGPGVCSVRWVMRDAADRATPSSAQSLTFAAVVTSG